MGSPREDRHPETAARTARQSLRTPSGIETPVVATAADSKHSEIGEPGQYPFTRGIFADGFRGRLWTIRQYSGFGTAEDSNQRYRFLLDQGRLL